MHLAFDHDFPKPIQDLVVLDIAALNALITPLIGTNKRLVMTGGTAFVQPDHQGGEIFEDSPRSTGPRVVRPQSEEDALAYAQKGVHVNAILLPFVYGLSGWTGFIAQLI